MPADQQWDIVTDVGLTALAVAAGRARESERPDPLMTDPYAAPLVAAADPPQQFSSALDDTGSAPVDADLWAAATDYLAVRSRNFDDFFRGAADAGVTQAVILASGLDTRPFRLTWPSEAVCFELDQPAVLDFKLHTLTERGATPACAHHPVGVDLRQDWPAALEDAGFDPARPTAWLAEGLLPYLPPEAEDRLLKEITRLSAPGSRFAVEQVANVHEVLDQEVVREASRVLTTDLPSLMPGGEREPVDSQLDSLGWTFTNVPMERALREHGRDGSAHALFHDSITHTFAHRS